MNSDCSIINHMDHSGLLLLLVYILTLTPDSNHLPFIYSILKLQNTYIVVSELLNLSPQGTYLSEYGAYIQFLLPIDYNHYLLPKLLVSIFPPPLQ